MKLIDSTKAVLYEDIIGEANNLGVKLPEDYVEFMIVSNGGKPEDDVLFDFFDEVAEQNNTSVIRRFFGINSLDTNKDIVNICKIMRQEEMISHYMVPIADDPAGNIIAMSTADKDYGVIYYLNHEYEDEDTGFLVESKIADSFKAFIESLYLDL